MNIKKLLITYTILIILLFIPGISSAFFIQENITAHLFEFLTPVMAFNFIFTILNVFTSDKGIEEKENNNEEFSGQNKLLKGISIILIHIPVILILGLIHPPLNALIFSLFTIIIISIP